MLRLLVFCLLCAVFFGNTEGLFRRVCERQRMYLSCPSSRFINILDASYGRTRQGVCGRNGNTNCHAGTSMSVVRHECQGQRSCLLHAVNSAFGDPCKGTVKYLEVTYECVSARCEGVLLRSCEGRSRFISCPFWQKINIISANYGRLTGGHICPGPVKTTYCGAAGSLGKVRSYCQGKRSCIIRATNSRFGDPCRGTKKYLEVRYKCV